MRADARRVAPPEPVATASASAPPTPSRTQRRDGPDPLLGRVINERFHIVGMIARGGMGKVYRAEQAPLGRAVALKVLHPTYHGEHDPEFHKRFFLEASTCSRLTHPNTVTVFDYGRTQGEDEEIYYIAMELLEGQTLHRALREEKPLPSERAMHIARQVCRSLREAHTLGVIHRDLKPANIFLARHGDESDFAKVLDFGLVKDMREQSEELTQTGLFMGSPKYMSPEQIRGEDIDPRADVYSLGVILYEMICGQVPFDRPNSVNILMAHVHEAPTPPSRIAPKAHIDPVLEGIVLKAMAKDPEDRFRSMDALLIALKRASSSVGLSSRSGEAPLSGELPLESASDQVAIEISESSEFGSVSASLTPPVALASPHSSPPPVSPGRRRRAGRVVALAVMLAAAAIGAYVAQARRSAETAAIAETNARAPIPEREPEPEPAAEPIARPEPAPNSVLLSLRSTPPGALVQIHERRYGPTPADVELRGEGVAPGAELTLRFLLEGYRDLTVTRTVAGSSMRVRVELDALPSEPPGETLRRPRRSVETAPRTPSVGLEGYKAEPY